MNNLNNAGQGRPEEGENELFETKLRWTKAYELKKQEPNSLLLKIDRQSAEGLPLSLPEVGKLYSWDEFCGFLHKY